MIVKEGGGNLPIEICRKPILDDGIGDVRALGKPETARRQCQPTKRFEEQYGQRAAGQKQEEGLPGHPHSGGESSESSRRRAHQPIDVGTAGGGDALTSRGPGSGGATCGKPPPSVPRTPWMPGRPQSPSRRFPQSVGLRGEGSLLGACFTQHP